MHPELSRRALAVLAISCLFIFSATTALYFSGGAHAVSNANTQLAQASLVPCQGALDCTICSGVSLLQAIINFCILLALLIATPLFAYAGIIYMTSGGDPGKRKKGNDIFTSVGIGIALTLCGWLIVDTIIHTVIINNNSQFFSGGQTWYSVGSCSQSNATRQAQLFRSVSDWLGGLFSTNPTITAGPGPEGGSFSCPTGSSPAGTAGCAWNSDSGKTGYAIPNGYACFPGSSFNPDNADCIDENGISVGAPTPGGTVAPLSSTGGSGCDPSVVSQAAQQAGYTITSGEASALACISSGEDQCGSGSVTNYNWGRGSSAAGAYQVLFQRNSNCYDNSVCEAAAGQSGTALNCGSAFSGGNPKSDPASQSLVNKCLQAAANVPCSAASAACLVQANPSMSDWASGAANSCKAANNI